ncbi:PTS sugar transporter subunit IIA [Demequina zhanjiangensis]|uniref:Mannitol-specific phosphotransferase enzyme IIA component n=1 Tax=Demequina zhanjiangensis TaxID=3051659 RepID=A0ABT8G2B6_9MICO|nr:PTS sugar transporter subunit IIA [Demequina sp. SYSU T00b26]MDN4472849.1 PTS sugar transporter subunit IIA [Demequina sp. SYSU T00b26]
MAILSEEGVRLGLTAADKADALTQCGDLLVAIGAATQDYADALHERETQVTTYIGEGVAIPHGTNESREHIQRAAIAYLQFPDGVDWDGQTVQVCIAIASRSEEHIDILQKLAAVLMDPEAAAKLREPAGVADVLALLAPDES